MALHVLLVDEKHFLAETFHALLERAIHLREQAVDAGLECGQKGRLERRAERVRQGGLHCLLHGILRRFAQLLREHRKHLVVQRVIQL